MKNIRYYLIYISLLVVLQMLYFSIYNIPIYKIYCDLNNYYLNSQNLYDQINYKYYIYVELINCSSFKIFSDFLGQTLVNEHSSYIFSDTSHVEISNPVINIIYKIGRASCRERV